MTKAQTSNGDCLYCEWNVPEIELGPVSALDISEVGSEGD